MHIAVVGTPGRLALRRLDGADGTRATGGGDRGRSATMPATPASLADVEREAADRRPRWVWWSTLGQGDAAHPSPGYPALLRAGVRLERAHDLGLAERLLAGAQGRNPDALEWARLPGEPEPAEDAANLLPLDGLDGLDVLDGHDGLGPSDLPDGRGSRADAVASRAAPAHLDDVARTLADQQRRIATTPDPRRFALLVAAESAAALAAAEMSHAGLPWRLDVHDRLLRELLGARPAFGGRPARLQALAERVAAALGAPGLNLDSQPHLLRALRRAGLPVRSTGKWELRRHEHPALEPLHHYKELYRLHVAHGWAWADQWVREGRFRPQYVPGGVVSGRWATRGGGALQIPKAVRGAVMPDDGWVLIGADAGQLEPRVLAALSGDPRMVKATRAGDLYAALAEQAFGRADARQEAKIGLLAAMYGGGTGSPELAALRRRFPVAFALVEDAARIGENGGVVRSVLGRTCPPPSGRDLEWPEDAEDVPAAARSRDGDRDPQAVAAARGRARGRFTRNFVIQGSAADWANVLIAILRGRLAAIGGAPDGRWHDDRPHLVFFQHDEVLVHSPAEHAEAACAAVRDAAAEATRLVLGDVGVPVPLEPAVIASYAEKG
ncbi:MAG: bifunctional 3'-5' exonuclease/DNA polymerase [Kineosporiaceae bacterium]